MTSTVETEATVTIPLEDWSQADWRKLEQHVYCLQKRIYRAQCRGNEKAVHSLQRLLMKSWAARMLAVRRVTQDNQGKRTAGIDGIKDVAPRKRLAMVQTLRDQRAIKARPVRRVLIPKPGKMEMRPLGIPVMLDRAHQAMVKLALEPQWEARFEPNSYGFRPGRSCHDAIEAIFNGVKQEPKFVFDADIKGCFDNISHEALLHKLDAIPTIRRAVKAWLQAGVMEGLDFTPTIAGTPQGGVISPLLANIALHGLEDAVTGCYHHYRYYDARDKNGKRMSYRFQPILVRYADDFVVLYPTMEGMEVIQHTVEQFLAGMSLHLNPEKTRIVHTLDHHNGEPGFDFLGFNIRQYRVGKTHGMKPDGKTPQGFKTLIRPSKDAIRRHIATLRDIIRKHRSAKQDVLIYALNPVITGWTRYYRTGTSTETFCTCEYILYRMLRRWAERRHLTKSKHWVSKRYWRNMGNKWRFGDNRVYIWLHPDTHIQRHYKVRGTASPYDGNLVYWTRRLKQHPLNRTAESQLLQRQQGRCVECGLHFQDGDLWEVDHIDPRGGERITNKQLLHRHCHDRKTVRMGDHLHHVNIAQGQG